MAKKKAKKKVVKKKVGKIKDITEKVGKDIDEVKDKADVVELNYTILPDGLDKSPDGWHLYKISIEKFIRGIESDRYSSYDYTSYHLIPHYRQNTYANEFLNDKYAYLKIGSLIVVKGQVGSETLYNKSDSKERSDAELDYKLFNAIKDLLATEKVHPKDVKFTPDTYLDFYRETMFGKPEILQNAEDELNPPCCGGYG